MSEFVFLYRNGQRPTSPEEAQQVLQKWMAWFKGLAEKGHVVDRGQPLERSGKVVQNGTKAVVDGPFAEAKDVVGGYSLIKAADIAEASELAKGCPVLDRGGYVEVRPVMKF
ncbi:MAG: YciI family protein [Phycisphaerales bacterium]